MGEAPLQFNSRIGRGCTVGERERERERVKNINVESVFFFLKILITIGLPLYHVSLILYKMRENRRLINGRGASPLTRCDKNIISNGDLLYEE